MNGTFTTLLGPVLVLWIGALVFDLLDRWLEPQDRGVAEAVVLGLALGCLLAAQSGSRQPLELAPSLATAGWPGDAPFLIAERAQWTLALVLLGTTLASSLASLGMATTGRAGRMAALGGALLYLFAGDWATLALAWVLVDLALVYALGSDGEIGLGRYTLVLSLFGAVACGIAVLLWQAAGSDAGIDPNAPVLRYALPLAIAAALLRLMPFPLPTWSAGTDRDGEREQRPIARVALYAIPTALGADLWMRLAQHEIVTEDVRWLWALSAGAVLAILAAGLKAWAAESPDQLVASASSFGVAAVLLAASLPLSPNWQLVHSVAALLGVSVLLLSWTQCQYWRVYNLHTYWRIVPAVLSVLSLAGAPMTVGYPAQAGLYLSLFAGNRWLYLLALMAGQALFLGAAFRVVFDVEATQPEDDASDTWSGVALCEIGYGAGAALALVIVTLGLAPGLSGPHPLSIWLRLPSVPVWAAIMLPAVGAVALYRSRYAVLDTTRAWHSLVRRLLRIEWPYRVGSRLLGQAGLLIWGATQVIQGAGHMAWVVLACLVLLLFILAR